MRKMFTLLLLFTAILSSSLFAQCNPEFTFTVNGSNGAVQFSPVTTGAAQHQWLFGDGTSSFAVAPFHYYAPGVYNVVHVVTNFSPNDSTTAQCTDSSVRWVTVPVLPPCNITAAYTFTRDSSVSNTVYFANLSTGAGPNTVVRWSFGDGTSSYENNPVHTYQASGAYTVCLTVMQDNLCTDSVCNIVEVLAPANPCNLSVNFTAYRDSFNNAFHFYSLISPQGAADSVQWLFGDGSSSTELNPVHAYNQPGTYSVCLIASNFSGGIPCVREYCQPVTVEGISCNMSAGYTFVRDSVQTNKVYFTNTSAGTDPNTIVTWNFGDGGAAYGNNPTHIYQAAGLYTVCISVRRDSFCVSDTCGTVQVQFPSNPCNLSVNFTASIDSLHTNIIHFANQSTPYSSADSVTWIFGDGTSSHDPFYATHTYTQGGVFNVCLVVRKNGTATTAPCVKEFCQRIIVDTPQNACNLVVNFTTAIDSLHNNVIHFFNQSTPYSSADSVTWIFGDGTSSHEPLYATHTYTQGGVFNVCLVVRKNGTATTAPCVREFCQRIIVDTPQDACNLVVNFTTAIDSLHNNVIHFFNQSTPYTGTDSVTWIFGDGTSSHEPLYATHTYTQGGVFNVCLVVRKNGTATTAPCVREFCQRIIVDTPQNACNLVVNFTTAIDSLHNNVIHFFNQSTPYSSADSVTWVFGDGTSSHEPLYATHTYTQGGVFNVCLVVRKNGTNTTAPCVREFCQRIIVDTPQVQCNLQAYFLTSTDSSNNNTIYFINQSAPLVSGDSMHWSFGDGTSSADLNPVHTYTAPGTYTVCLLIKRYQAGNVICARDFCQTIVVVQQPAQCNLVADFTYYSDSISGNNPSVYHFTNTSTPLAAIDSSVWDFGDGTTWVINRNEAVSHTYTTAGTYTVCLWVMKSISDSLNSACDRRICKTITVSGPINVCDELQVRFNWTADSMNNRKVYFNNQSSPLTANTFANWSFGDGTSSMAASPEHIYAQPGTYTVCLQMRLGNVCVKDTCTTIVIFPPTVDSCNNNIYPSFTSSIDSLNRRKVYFTNTTTTAAAGLYAQWTFGDGTSGTGWNADHTYAMPGWYAVCLTVRTGNTCTKTQCDSIFVPGNVIPPVNCDTFQLRFSYRRDFMPNKLFFHATSNAPVYNQQWTFTQLGGDSAYTTVNQNNPVYVFPEAGVYRVCVKAAFSNACTKEFCDEVTIHSSNIPSTCRLRCYPNPARNQVSFDVQLNQPGVITASVYNFHSSVVKNYTQQGAAGNNQVTLNIRDLPRGIYSVRIRYGGNVCFTRFIKF